MATNPRYANGHRRRELRKRKLAAGGYCAWPGCPWPDDWLNTQAANDRHQWDDNFPEVDEIIPMSYGGDPLSTEGTRLLHRWCNGRRSNKPDEAASKHERPILRPSPGWGPRR